MPERATMISLAMIPLAMISQDAIFSAVITVGVGLVAAFLATYMQSRDNAKGIQRIEEELSAINLRDLHTKVSELWEDRRDTWKFLQNRGDSEVEQKGLGRRNSPISIRGIPEEQTIAHVYDSLLPELLKLEAETGLDSTKETDQEALWRAIAKRFDKRLIAEVCPSLGVFDGGCVSLAIAVMRRHKQLEQGSPAIYCSTRPSQK